MGILKKVQAALYRVPVWGELAALRKLFSPQFLRGLEKSERESQGGSDRLQVSIDLAWIDKIPLAGFVSSEKDLDNKPITQRVELGDLLIVRTRAMVLRGKLIVQDSRSAIVQA